MKERFKEQKAITLIALIITIIILLILAVVSIKIINNMSIIKKAERASDKYQMEQLKEQAELIKGELKIKEYNNEAKYNWDTLISEVNKGIEGSSVDGNIITTQDEKYDIRINSDYSIEVAKHGELINTYNVEELNSSWSFVLNKIDDANYTGRLYLTMNQNVYANCLNNTYSNEEKWTILKQMYDSTNASYIDEVKECLIIYINENEYYINDRTSNLNCKKRTNKLSYTTIEECLNDESIKNLNITKLEQLYLIHNQIITGNSIKWDLNNVPEMTIDQLLYNEFQEFYTKDIEVQKEKFVITMTRPNKEQENIVISSFEEYNDKIITNGEQVSITQNGTYTFKAVINGKTVSTYSKEVTEIKNYTLYSQVEIGDYVNYDDGTGQNNKWRVFDKSSNKVTLISELPIGRYTLSSAVNGSIIQYSFSRKVEEICSEYGNGNGAVSVRSVKYSEANYGYNENDIKSQLLYINPKTGEGINYFINYEIYYNQKSYDDGIVQSVTGYYVEDKILKSNYAAYKTATFKGSGIGNSAFTTKNYGNLLTMGIRPVVELDSTLRTTGQDANGVWQIEFAE